MALRIFLVFAISVIYTPSSFAKLEVAFFESAPKDSFVITNMTECKLEELVLTIDLSTSDGKLIFDTTSRGLGVEVFQPFEVSTGQFKLLEKASVDDGDEQISLQITKLIPQEVISFTVDVDDRLVDGPLGQTQVANAELSGTQVFVYQNKKEKLTLLSKATFQGNNLLALPISNTCT